MPPTYCGNCTKTFTTFQGFQKHLDYNTECFQALVSRKDCGHGLSRPNKRSRKYKNESRKQFLEGLEEVLEEEKLGNLKKQIEETLNKGDVFDYDPENELPPLKTLRVGDLSPAKVVVTKELGVLPGKESVLSIVGTQNVESNKANLGLADANVTSLPTEDNDDNHALCADDEDINNSNSAEAMDVGDDEPVLIGQEEQQQQQQQQQQQENNQGMLQPDSKPMEDFREYVQCATKDFCRLSPDMKAAIELMSLMDIKGGSVALFDDVMEWHMRHRKQEKAIHSEKLYTDLIDRYNLGPTLPKERSVTLPHSKEHVHLPCHDAKAQLVDLLTDPRLCDDDYLFIDDSPMAGVPEEFERVGDVNTGLAYRETYKIIVAPSPLTASGRRKVLCPIIFYIDGCVTGSFMNLNIEILKFTIGLFKGKTRTCDWAWRNLGYVKKRCKRNQSAQENITVSAHVDANLYVKDPKHRSKQYPSVEGPAPQFDWEIYAKQNGKKKKKAPRVNAQDFHTMLQTIMDSYKTIEDEGGFEWDLRFKAKTYNLTLIPFIVFVKADSVEADKVCGAYGAKSEHLKCICRYCCVPTQQTGEPFLDPEPEKKTQAMMVGLVTNATNGTNEEKKLALEKLQGISQHCLWNTFYQFRFGLHNNSGIHGASPWEILHWILLGFFKYDREALFLQTGESSKLSKALDALAQTFGHFLDRQSDRTLPRVAFNDGIRQGKMQGHEMVGVILLLTLALRSRAGRDLLLDKAWGKQKGFFPREENIKDWIKMLESHLMFEKWLRKEEYDVAVLERAKMKMKEFLQFTKDVGQRKKGMGYNTANFHGTLHMPEMALNLCAFIHMDTGCNESHHKKDKKSAKRTNKQLESFDICHANKVVQRHAVELAMEELSGTIKRWKYYRRGLDADEPQPKFFPPTFKGPVVRFFYDHDQHCFLSKIYSKMIGKEMYVYDDNTLAFILDMAKDLYEHDGITSFEAYGTLDIFSPTCENSTQHFYAKPYTGGKPWNDWAIFDLRDPEAEDPDARSRVPAQIKCFLDFSSLPPENAIMKKPGLYAIVEPTVPNPQHDEKWWSRIFDPCCKTPCTVPGFANHNSQELVNIFNIVDTAVLVPDHNNPNPRAYLRVIPISLWANMFEDWIMADEEEDD
jgi:hypothetical protein